MNYAKELKKLKKMEKQINNLGKGGINNG